MQKTLTPRFLTSALVVVCAAVNLLPFVGCGPPDDALPGVPPAPGRKAVYVDSYPLKYFAQRLAGDVVDVVFPCPAGADPAYLRPSDEAIRGYQSADLILLNGATYAKWVTYVSLPESRLVDTSQGFAANLIPLEDVVVHSHGPGGQHAHEGIAFTTWLDPRQALQQAAAVNSALVRLAPDKKRQFDERFAKLQQDIGRLDHALTAALEGCRPQPLLASHPVYQYLSRRCGWNLKSVHWEPDEVPDAGQWQELAKILRQHPAKWMIWEATPQAEIVRRLQVQGVTCIVFEPCGNVPKQGDYLSVMERNVENLKVMAGKR
jgi:zinc transport system substrate-binding protein